MAGRTPSEGGHLGEHRGRRSPRTVGGVVHRARHDLGHVLLEELLAPRGGGVVDEGERRDGILLKRRKVHTRREPGNFLVYRPSRGARSTGLKGGEYQLIKDSKNSAGEVFFPLSAQALHSKTLEVTASSTN